LHLQLDDVHPCGRMQHGVIIRHSFIRTFFLARHEASALVF
jgi:hypothetical protein